jgi:hypothetical protein
MLEYLKLLLKILEVYAILDRTVRNRLRYGVLARSRGNVPARLADGRSYDVPAQRAGAGAG